MQISSNRRSIVSFLFFSPLVANTAFRPTVSTPARAILLERGTLIREDGNCKSKSKGATRGHDERVHYVDAGKSN